MLKILVKKQLTEIFRSYFYDAKTTRPAPRAQPLHTFAFSPF